jgi:hypothetical protein
VQYQVTAFVGQNIKLATCNTVARNN